MNLQNARCNNKDCRNNITVFCSSDCVFRRDVILDCVWNVVAHAQKPDFVFHRKGRVHLNRQGRQFSRLLAAEVCASALVMLDKPRSVVVWEYCLPTPFASFPFTSPPVRHRVPSGFKRTLTNISYHKGAYRVERHSESGQSFLTGIMGYKPLRSFEKHKVTDSAQNNSHTAPSRTDLLALCSSLIKQIHHPWRDWESSVGIATRYGLDGPGIESRWGEIFRTLQTGPGAHPASYTMGTGPFPGVKQPRRGVDHPPHLAPRLKKE